MDPQDHVDALARKALNHPEEDRPDFLWSACSSAEMYRAVRTRIAELQGDGGAGPPGADAKAEDRAEGKAPTEPLPGSDLPTVPHSPEEAENDGLPGDDAPPTEPLPDGDESGGAATEGATETEAGASAQKGTPKESSGAGDTRAEGSEATPGSPDRTETQTAPPAGPVATETQEGGPPTGPPPGSEGGERHPERVGRWRLLERIGQGGMGSVYRAERADGQFEQQAALKLIRQDLGPEAQRRFLSERQILAQLQHPNIAHLLDGGVTEDGRPYFAMEYVDGTPIDQYCYEHELGVEARLRLFRQICEAVQFAHSNLIVHRDLKPGNILVTEQGTETGASLSGETATTRGPGGGGPQVKLLDFGIAKALEGAEEIGVHTKTGESGPMTPPYAAPEQVQGEGVTTATDVYAMGLVLCELVSGSLPYEVRGRAPVETAQVIAEAEPTPPSALVSRDAASKVVAAIGEGSVEALENRLQGDLDVIVRKALRKEPDRRYASATAFGQDIDRHLEGLPVEARPATTGYRLRRFVERNRAAVLAAAGAVVALLVGLGAAIWQAQVAAAERDRAQQLAEEAQQNADRAEAVQTFLVDMFDQAGPAETGGETLTVQDVLDDAEAELTSQALQNQPHARMEVRQSIADIYRQLDRWEPSIEQARTAYETGLETFGPDDPQTLRAGYTYGVSSLLAGRIGRADSVFGAVVPRLDDADAPPKLRFDVLARYGDLLQRRSRVDSAEAVLQQSLQWFDQIEEPDSANLASVFSRLGGVYRLQRRLDESEKQYKRALDVVDEESYSTKGTITQNLGNLYNLQGQYEKAEELYRRNLDISRRLYGEESIAVATAYMSLSKPLMGMGRLQEADSLSAEALSRLRNHPESSGYRLAFALLRRVKVLEALQRYEEALPLAEKAQNIFETIYDDPTDRRIVASHQDLARLHWQMGRTKEAAPHYKKALEGNRALLDSTTAPMATYMSRLGAARIEQGRYEEAEELLLEAKSVQDDSAAVAKTRERLSTLYEAWPQSGQE